MSAMKRAWEIRKEAAAKFGCKVMDIHFGTCLSMAWAEIKNGGVKMEGTKKQVDWAEDILNKIEKYSGVKVSTTHAGTIITLGKGVTNINVDEKIEIINGFNFAEEHGLVGLDKLEDIHHDIIEKAVTDKKITMNAYMAIRNKAYIVPR